MTARGGLKSAGLDRGPRVCGLEACRAVGIGTAEGIRKIFSKILLTRFGGVISFPFRAGHKALRKQGKRAGSGIRQIELRSESASLDDSSRH